MLAERHRACTCFPGTERHLCLLRSFEAVRETKLVPLVVGVTSSVATAVITGESTPFPLWLLFLLFYRP